MTTIDVNITRLANFNGYLNSILAEFPAPEGENEQEDPLILTLVCFQKTLERRITKRTPTREWCDVMRWAVIEANKTLDHIYDKGYEFVEDWNPTDPPTNQQQALTAVLMLLCHELIGDVAQGEDYLKEELKTAADEFARETFAAYEVGNLELEADEARAG
jgi:hypothetical protein